MAAQFIGVQLEIESPRPVGYLMDAFSGSDIIAFDYRESKRGFSVVFEYSGAGSSTDPDAQIARFCDLLNGFKERPKSVWDGAHRRTFNLGYQIDAIPGCFRSELKPATVRKLAQLGTSVTVSIYPAEPPDHDGGGD